MLGDYKGIARLFARFICVVARTSLCGCLAVSREFWMVARALLGG